MALPNAQLGQLPSMNLNRPGGVQYNEAAWHKALTAFLVNAAGQAASTGVGNAMAPDYSKQAQAAGLPGADGKEQSFASQVLHGPQWDKTALREGMRDQATDKRFNAQESRFGQELGLKKEELAALEKQRIAENAARAKEQGNTDAYRTEQLANESRAQNSRDAAQLSSVELEQARLNELIARRGQEGAQFGLLHDPNNPINQSTIGLHNAQANMYNAAASPSFAGDKAAAVGGAEMQQALGMIKEMDRLKAIREGRAPTNNSDSFNPHNTGTQSVPGGQPQEPYQGLDLSGLGIPSTPASTTPPVTQSISPIDSVRARERANTAAGTSSQMGQSADMSAQPVDNSPPPITQGQPTAQAVGTSGFPSDALALTRPAQTPNSPTGVLPSSAVNYMPPITFDPETLKRAAMLARLLGQPQSVGGTPNAAGSGGLPTGYG